MIHLEDSLSKSFIFENSALEMMHDIYKKVHEYDLSQILLQYIVQKIYNFVRFKRLNQRF